MKVASHTQEELELASASSQEDSRGELGGQDDPTRRRCGQTAVEERGDKRGLF